MSAYGFSVNGFAAAARAYDNQAPEHDDTDDRIEARIASLSDAQLGEYMRRFCESGEELVVQTAAGEYVNTKLSACDIFNDWLEDCIAREIANEDRLP